MSLPSPSFFLLLSFSFSILANFQGLRNQKFIKWQFLRLLWLKKSIRKKRVFEYIISFIDENTELSQSGVDEKTKYANSLLSHTFYTRVSPPSTRSPLRVMSRKTSPSKEEEANEEKTGLSSLDAFIDEAQYRV